MQILRIRWAQDRIDHIAKHRLKPYEVEEAAFNDPFAVVKKVGVSYRNRNEYIYVLLGRSEAGKYIAFFFIPKKQGPAYPVTAREMDESERRLYNDGRP
ncbi:MAG: BrnT family toxin [Eubacteriales bacterium]